MYDYKIRQTDSGYALVRNGVIIHRCKTIQEAERERANYSELDAMIDEIIAEERLDNTKKK